MAKRQLRCFVAMAVGRPNTDRVYDRYIAPTLRAAKILPVFMGRLEHNDDIDKRIIREIEACDLAIADLTYARPSVYFEAGYAQREVPVIYTAQQNHLQPRRDDEFGNFRVHFDLLMRNIIPWSSPNDASFPRKLTRRISKVVAPMLRQRQLDDLARAEELRFQGLPLSSRLEFVSEGFTKALKRSGYRPLVAHSDVSPWVGRLPSHQTLNIGAISVQASFTQREIREQANHLFELLKSRFESFEGDGDADGYNRQRLQEYWQNTWHGHKLPRKADTRYVRRVVARLILCSLEKIPRGRLTTALPSYAADGDGRVFTLNSPVVCSYMRSLPGSLAVFVIDGIKSRPDAIKKSEELKRVFAKLH
jgi:nucleoside 2-deoxyribosyltransferase